MFGSRGLVPLALVLVAVVGCAPGPREPRPVNPALDVCPECRMSVIPEGHAAEAVDSEEIVMVFDDPGCLALHRHDHPEHFAESALFVQDVVTKAWIAWDEAWFFEDIDRPSPMNYGWHATSDSGVPGGRRMNADELAAALLDKRWQP